MENPDVVHKVCDGPWLHQTERTVHATAPRLWSVPKSHPALLIYFQFVSLLFSLVKHERLCWLSPRDTSLDFGRT